jgi:hypothetical protein
MGYFSAPPAWQRGQQPAGGAASTFFSPPSLRQVASRYSIAPAQVRRFRSGRCRSLWQGKPPPKRTWSWMPARCPARSPIASPSRGTDSCRTNPLAASASMPTPRSPGRGTRPRRWRGLAARAAHKSRLAVDSIELQVGVAGFACRALFSRRVARRSRPAHDRTRSMPGSMRSSPVGSIQRGRVQHVITRASA